MNYEIIDFEYAEVSDTESVDDLPEEYIKEEKYFSKLNMINLFKKDIQKEPEFYGIKNISDVELYNFIENPGSTKCNHNITDHQEELFDDLYVALFGIKESKQTYIRVINKIYKKCYC